MIAPRNAVTDFYRDKRVLITGQAGFIGSALWSTLRYLKAETFGIDKRAVSPLLGDVKNLYQVRRAFDIAKPDIVFHLAACTEVRASLHEPMETYKTNVLGTLNVLEIARERKTSGIVVASTDKVYGTQTNAWEGSPLMHDNDIYSSSKKAADELAQDYWRIYKLPLIVARPVNTYGPGQTNDTTLITSTIKKALAGDKIEVFNGSRNHKREWLYIDDAVYAYLHCGFWAVNYSGSYTYPPVINIGSGQVWSVDQIVRAILGKIAPHGMLDYDLVADTHPQAGSQSVDSRKLRGWLADWKPLPIGAGLDRTIEWHRGNCK